MIHIINYCKTKYCFNIIKVLPIGLSVIFTVFAGLFSSLDLNSWIILESSMDQGNFQR